eukprot:TRINITY_DN2470_c1_g1_i1.p1 TRINITY_DN2470_c1_g1~~TRINITY_DN2470_c1_g1_i1.p1  ORF type:complete len:393 (-),score=74.83 TRINITY_DN2470_c1_g1_i1:363-1541(-)
MALPLKGVRVLAFEQAIAMPLATRNLAALGASVIKIERPGTGDYVRGLDRQVRGTHSSHFIWTNERKRSLCIDLTQEGSVEVVMAILKDTDVCVSNLRPGVMSRFGLGFDSLRVKYPRLITCNISGYGTHGDAKSRKAYDVLVQAESGLMSITGTPDEMCKSGIAISDIAAGMYAYSGILAALLGRDKENARRHVEVSMLDAMGEFMGYPLMHQAALPRLGMSHQSIAPYGPQKCKDGIIMIAAQTSRDWKTVCERVLRQPQLTEDARFNTPLARHQNRIAMDEIFESAFADMTVSEVQKLLDRELIANGVVRSVAEARVHPQWSGKRDDKYSEASGSSHIIPLPNPVRRDEDIVIDRYPRIGQHTATILAESGYEEGEIEQLIGRKIVYSE